jgi:hypothetical protein
VSDDVQVEVEVDEGATAKERVSWLAHNTRIWLIVLVLLVLAGIVVATSYAAFTSSSANAGNIVATGSLIIDDDVENGAFLLVDGLVPGDSATGSVTISNVGESTGDFTLTQQDLVDVPGPNGGNLSEVLLLRVVMDPDGVPLTLYDGAFNALTTLDLGSWEGGESHSFDFVVTFPEGTDDDRYQQSEVSVTYVWDAVTS